MCNNCSLVHKQMTLARQIFLVNQKHYKCSQIHEKINLISLFFFFVRNIHCNKCCQIHQQMTPIRVRNIPFANKQILWASYFYCIRNITACPLYSDSRTNDSFELFFCGELKTLNVTSVIWFVNQWLLWIGCFNE